MTKQRNRKRADQAHRNTKQLHINVNESLAESIDTFQFENRIRSRMGAIRQLLAAGLAASSEEHRRG